MSKKNDLVIDPYAGVGTTLLAAVKNNRISKGSEIIQKYINIANERFKLFVDGKLPYRDRNQEIKIVKGNSKLYFRND